MADPRGCASARRAGRRTAESRSAAGSAPLGVATDRGGIRRKDGVQPGVAIGADGDFQKLAVGGRVGQAILLDAHCVALGPGWVKVGEQPIRCNLGQIIQGGAHRFADQSQSAQGAQLAHDVGRIAALASSFLQQRRVHQGIERDRQGPFFGTSSQQPGAKRAQDAGIKARVIKVKRQGVFPIQPGAYRLGRTLCANMK